RRRLLPDLSGFLYRCHRQLSTWPLGAGAHRSGWDLLSSALRAGADRAGISDQSSVRAVCGAADRSGDRATVRPVCTAGRVLGAGGSDGNTGLLLAVRAVCTQYRAEAAQGRAPIAAPTA